MTGSTSGRDSEQWTATLVTRLIINASPEILFAAWTEPRQLIQWWGPEDVQCTEVEIDLRVGGAYRIANRLPDGSTLWISGLFDIIEPPHRLSFSWSVEAHTSDVQQVTVTFEPLGTSTEVIVVHDRIASAAIRDSHERGWKGCLAGLAAYIASTSPTFE
jgi:uncharacterized protein YndB with AHSA1/START domain